MDNLRWELAAARAERDQWQARHGGDDRVPATVYVAVDWPVAPLRELTATLRQRIVVRPDHRPVVLTDCRSFRFASTAGVVIEYLPDARTWRRHRPDESWEDLLTARLTRIFFDHGHGRAVVVDPSAPPRLADLLGEPARRSPPPGSRTGP